MAGSGGTRRGGPDAALSVWVVEQHEVTVDTFAFRSSCSIVTQTPERCLGHPDADQL